MLTEILQRVRCYLKHSPFNGCVLRMSCVRSRPTNVQLRVYRCLRYLSLESDIIYTYVRTYIHTCSIFYYITISCIYLFFVLGCRKTFIHSFIQSHSYIHTKKQTYMQTYVHTNIHTYVHYIYIHIHITSIQTYIYTYIHHALHICVCIYIHTYIHQYKHTYIKYIPGYYNYVIFHSYVACYTMYSVAD